MKLEQAHLFCRAAAMGIACGLSHRYEWFTNYLRSLQHTEVYADIPIKEQRAYEAFIAFEKMTASCPEEQVELDRLGKQGYCTLVNQWYNNSQRDR